MTEMKPCVVCGIPTRSVVQNSRDGGIKVDVYLCPVCIKLMQGDRMNEDWSFNGK